MNVVRTTIRHPQNGQNMEVLVAPNGQCFDPNTRAALTGLVLDINMVQNLYAQAGVALNQVVQPQAGMMQPGMQMPVNQQMAQPGVGGQVPMMGMANQNNGYVMPGNQSPQMAPQQMNVPDMTQYAIQHASEYVQDSSGDGMCSAFDALEEEAIQNSQKVNTVLYPTELPLIGTAIGAIDIFGKELVVLNNETLSVRPTKENSFEGNFARDVNREIYVGLFGGKLTEFILRKKGMKISSHVDNIAPNDVAIVTKMEAADNKPATSRQADIKIDVTPSIVVSKASNPHMDMIHSTHNWNDAHTATLAFSYGIESVGIVFSPEQEAEITEARKKQSTGEYLETLIKLINEFDESGQRAGYLNKLITDYINETLRYRCRHLPGGEKIGTFNLKSFSGGWKDIIDYCEKQNRQDLMDFLIMELNEERNFSLSLDVYDIREDDKPKHTTLAYYTPRISLMLSTKKSFTTGKISAETDGIMLNVVADAFDLADEHRTDLFTDDHDIRPTRIRELWITTKFQQLRVIRSVDSRMASYYIVEATTDGC